MKLSNEGLLKVNADVSRSQTSVGNLKKIFNQLIHLQLVMVKKLEVWNEISK